jgi:5-methylcytosine-specific restriction endonuclease McrA
MKEKYKQMCREMVEFTCQNCHKHEEIVGTLHAHRIIRGHKGGKYVPNNIMMVCVNCHKAFHRREF